MDFMVLSREKAKRLSFKYNIPDCAIISITDVGKRENLFQKNPHIKGVCKLQFDDVEKGELCAITENDAKSIVNFVNGMKAHVTLFVVHCEAGVSRSAGVCAAIMCMLGKNDMEIFENPKFAPNMTCYRAVLDAAGIEYDEKIVREKEEYNLDVWRKANDIEVEYNR